MRDPSPRPVLETGSREGVQGGVSPVAIVWPCPLSLDAYVAQGREIEIPEQFCPGCTGPMTRWSGYRRFVREAGRAQAIFVARLRCRACAVTHALLPSFCLLKRLDAAPTIGRVIEAVLDKASGVRPLALSSTASITRPMVGATSSRFRRQKLGSRAWVTAQARERRRATKIACARPASRTKRR